MKSIIAFCLLFRNLYSFFGQWTFREGKYKWHNMRFGLFGFCFSQAKFTH